MNIKEIIQRIIDKYLRDYFAAKAMQAIITAKPDEVGESMWPVGAEDTAYTIADAMIKARGK